MDDAPEGGAPAARGLQASDVALSPVERRVLGVLVEKALSTPEYYPLTLKALVAGCNQRNNRDPVLTLEEAQVEDALARLRGRGFVIAVKTDTGWATRWRHELDRKLTAHAREQAILAELLLRGAQSEGELRARASRMAHLPDLGTLHEVLRDLQAAAPPLVVRLSPEGAVRGVRWADLMQPAADVGRVHAERQRETFGETQAHPPADAAPSPRAAQAAALEARIARLEETVTVLEASLAELEARIAPLEGRF